ncbi:unnamed protein product [Nezara viridula]|uniref:Uncharacterized protein n=1 Tax=Nezara viridula TaxID=85310 RepID=A0A9P0E7M7_NEZVI|nr:unnamed protein product [Nezara viridula]
MLMMTHLKNRHCKIKVPRSRKDPSTSTNTVYSSVNIRPDLSLFSPSRKAVDEDSIDKFHQRTDKQLKKCWDNLKTEWKRKKKLKEMRKGEVLGSGEEPPQKDFISEPGPFQPLLVDVKDRNNNGDKSDVIKNEFEEESYSIKVEEEAPVQSDKRKNVDKSDNFFMSQKRSYSQQWKGG